MNIFEVIDKTKRKIYLSKERWAHIQKKHPEIKSSEEIIDALINPIKITQYSFEDSTKYYYKYQKDAKNYLLIVVKYLNGTGFIITAYLTKNIK